MKIPTTLRQGDVFLIRCDVATGARIARDARGYVVLALGEATGHAHTIRSRDATLYETTSQSAAALRLGERILKTRRPVALEHEEHATIRIPSGTWIVRIQRSYERGAVRNVAD